MVIQVEQPVLQVIKPPGAVRAMLILQDAAIEEIKIAWTMERDAGLEYARTLQKAFSGIEVVGADQMPKGAIGGLG